MGVAILSGILASLEETSQMNAIHASGFSTPSLELPPQLPSRFLACVKRKESAKRINSIMPGLTSVVEVLIDDNLKGVKAADVVLLACKPQMFREILGADGVKEALKGKLLISILAGVTVAQIEEFLYGDVSYEDPDKLGRCRIIRAMPNTASQVRESMTVIATSNPPLPSAQASLVSWMFNSIGRVVNLPPSTLDASTALCGSGPAFVALILEAMADGAVAMGLPRAEAQLMAAQTMRGTTGLVLDGLHPAILRDKVSTPGGCTIGGLLTLENNRVRGAVAEAVREATMVASQLGQGVKNVNGPRR